MRGFELRIDANSARLQPAQERMERLNASADMLAQQNHVNKNTQETIGVRGRGVLQPAPRAEQKGGYVGEFS